MGFPCSFAEIPMVSLPEPGRPAFGQRRASRCIEARDQNEDRSKEAKDDVDQVQTHGELLRMIKSLFNILGQSFFNGFFYGVL